MGRKGFSLLELTISMGILAIVMGGLVQLFGTSVMAQITGFNQQDMYAQARQMENELKNTLRYAVDNKQSSPVASIKFYDKDGNVIEYKVDQNNIFDQSAVEKMTYTAEIYDNNKAKARYHHVTLEWVDGKKQIKLSKVVNDSLASGEAGTDSAKSEIIFPKNEKNSAFDEEDVKADSKIQFPVALITGDTDLHSDMFRIRLPFKYKAGKEEKTNILETKVVFTNIGKFMPGLVQCGGGITVDPSKISGDLFTTDKSKESVSIQHYTGALKTVPHIPAMPSSSEANTANASIDITAKTTKAITISNAEQGTFKSIKGDVGSILFLTLENGAASTLNVEDGITGPNTSSFIIYIINKTGKVLELTGGSFYNNVIVLVNSSCTVANSIGGTLGNCQTVIVSNGDLTFTGKQAQCGILIGNNKITVTEACGSFNGAVMARNDVAINAEKASYSGIDADEGFKDFGLSELISKD